MEKLMSALVHEGRARQTCLGCTQKLEAIGLVRMIGETPLPVVNAEAGTFSIAIYEIVLPHTIEQCRAAIGFRHVGPPWGGTAEESGSIPAAIVEEIFKASQQ